MFSTDVLDLCVTQTDGHYRRPPHPSARAQNFKSITHSDFFKVIAAKIIMGIDYKPEIKHYWSKDKILGGSIIISLRVASDRIISDDIGSDSDRIISDDIGSDSDRIGSSFFIR